MKKNKNTTFIIRKKVKRWTILSGLIICLISCIPIINYIILYIIVDNYEDDALSWLAWYDIEYETETLEHKHKNVWERI